ncbi:MAG: sulfurtransferase TusA family protein [bacterium]
MKADATLDAFGLLCPMPVVQTAKKIEEMKVGEILEVLATDEGVKEDIPAWCRTVGHEFLGIEEKDGEYRVYLRKLK